MINCIRSTKKHTSHIKENNVPDCNDIGKPILLLLFLICFLIPVHGSAETLQDGVPFNTNLNPGIFASIEFIVPEQAAQLTVKLSNGSGDLDLYLKYGSPLQGNTVAELDANTDFISDTSTANETIKVTPSSNPPLKAGSWYVTTLNYNGTKTSFTITASVVIEEDSEPSEPIIVNKTFSTPYLVNQVNSMEVTLTWLPVNNANQYLLYYAPYPFTGESSIGTIALDNLTSSSFKLWDKAAYYVAIMAQNGNATIGELSNIETILIDTDNSIRNIKLKGSVDIPKFQPAGPLLIVVSGEDDQPYYSGASDINGHFDIDLNVFNNEKKLTIAAIASEDPNNAVLAVINLPHHFSIVNQASQRDTKNEYNITLNAQSTADSIVQQQIKNRTLNIEQIKYTDDELKLRDSIKSDFLFNGMQVCNKNIVESLSSLFFADNVMDVDKRMDTYLAQPGTLQEKIARAVKDVSDTVASSNKGWIITTPWRPFKVGGTLRRNIARMSPLMTDGGFKSGFINYNELQNLADYIMYEEYGNCREKGIMGAYIASRLDDFQQIAIVAVSRPNQGGGLFTVNHAFSVACKQKSEVWNLGQWHVGTETHEALIKDFNNEADCYIIDPWTETVAPLTRSFLEKTDWVSVLGVLSVKIDGQLNQKSQKSYAITRSDASNEASINVCELQDVSNCDAFNLPATCQMNSKGIFDCDKADTSCPVPAGAEHISSPSGEHYELNGIWVGPSNSYAIHDGEWVIMTHNCRDAEGQKQGGGFSYFSDGSIQSSAFYIDNKLDGHAYKYYFDGIVSSDKLYDNGGLLSYSSYYESGNIRSYETYQSGRTISISSTGYNEDGSIIYQRLNGRSVTEENWVDPLK